MEHLVGTPAADVVAVAAPGIGGGIGVWASLRFVRWIIEFIARRLDVRAARLSAREREIEARFDSRLRHVEGELALYREATMLLVNRIAEIMPQDPVLGDVAKILRGAIPIPKPNAKLEELARRAGEALDGSD